MRNRVPVFLPVIFAGMLAAGCLPTAHTREAMKLDTYLGGPINVMVQDMGTPSLSGRREDGSWVYAWRGCRVTTDWYGRDFSRYCEITAVSDGQGNVTRWNWWGNECPLDGVASGCHGMLWWQP